MIDFKKFLSYPKIFLLLFFSIFLILDYNFFEKKTKKVFLSWDEVNYALSAEKGILENVFEIQSSNFIKFLKLGQLKFNKNDNENNIASLNLINENDDIFYLRHLHPPLSSMYWSLFIDNDRSKQDLKLRNSQNFIIYSLIIFLMLISIYYNLNNILIKVAFIFLVFNSNIVSIATNNLNFHLIFSLTSLIYLVLLINLLKNNNFKNRLIFSFGVVLLFMSLETAPFILIGSFISLLIYYKKYNFYFNSVIIIFLKSLILLLVLWPANIYNLTILKNYFIHVYRIFLQPSNEYSEVNQLSLFSNIFINDYVLIISILLIFILLLINLKRIKQKSKFLITFIHGFIYLILIFPFAYHPNYILPTIFIFSLSIIYILDEINLTSRFLNYSLISFIFLIFINYFNVNTIKKNTNSVDIISFTINDINKHNQNMPILVDGAHIFKYYSKYDKIDYLNIYNPHKPKFFIRKDFNNINIIQRIKNNYYSMIILQKNRKYSTEQLNLLQNYGYYKSDNQKYYIFILK